MDDAIFCKSNNICFGKMSGSAFLPFPLNFCETFITLQKKDWPRVAKKRCLEGFAVKSDERYGSC